MVKDTKPAAKTEAKERKKPVRKAPVQKDYPNKLAWLKAMTEYEEKQTEEANAAKVARLDKRIATITSLIEGYEVQLKELKSERSALVPAQPEAEPQV